MNMNYIQEIIGLLHEIAQWMRCSDVGNIDRKIW